MAGLTIDNPVKFDRVLASKNVIPGDTLLLRGGVYSGDYRVTFAGTADRRITIANYPGERVVIDGSLWLAGSQYIDIVGLEICDLSYTDRRQGGAAACPVIRGKYPAHSLRDP